MINPPRTYVLFGNDDVHYINGKLLDKNCVGVLDCATHAEGRRIAYRLFGTSFALAYTGKIFNGDDKEYSRGYIPIKYEEV
jgi:hypothetical protein